MLLIGGLAFLGGPDGPSGALAAEPVLVGDSGSPAPPPASATTAAPTTTGAPATTAAQTTTSATTTSTSTTAVPTTTVTTSTLPPQPSEAPVPAGGRYLVSNSDVERDAKQLAADVAYSLTTYEASDDPMERFRALSPVSGVDLLAEAGAPLTHPGSWSRGQVIYAQLGGLTDTLASVMVVVRQTAGFGPETQFSVVRTLDIRLLKGDSGWEFDSLASAGGAFGDLAALRLADSVANDPRIEMSDSARLDILDGAVSPTLLRLMSAIADRTPYGVTVLATGHPHDVFDTDRMSDHTVGRAVDIYRVGDRLVVDDRDPDSATHALVEWLLERDDVSQVGSPWDLDGDASRRSFTNAVHQDHIHLAVVEP